MTTTAKTDRGHRGATTPVTDPAYGSPEPVTARVTSDTLAVDLADGRTISVPLAWFPRLMHGNRAERANFQLTYAGLHWPDLNEDISVAGLLRGEGSGESAGSLKRWLSLRAEGKREPVLERPLPGTSKLAAKRRVSRGVHKRS